MKLWVSLCFYYVENRLENFKKTINNLSNIPNIKITIDSNVNFDSNLDIRVAQLADPFHYTWQHKKYMPEFLKSDYTHFAYLEGNLNVTQKTFDYWLKTRQLFEKYNLNLIPGVHRIQKDKNGQIYSLDSIRKQTNRSTIEIENQTFVFLSEPYQGMFIMDKEMVQEHIKSNFYSLGLKQHYGIRESANLGNTYVNVLNVMPHRVVVPINIPEECMVEHFGTDYLNDPNSPHAKIKVSELFNAS